MIMPVPNWFGNYFEEHRHPPFSKWMIEHYYIYHSRWTSAQVFYFNDRWYLDTNPRNGKAKKFTQAEFTIRK